MVFKNVQELMKILKRLNSHLLCPEASLFVLATVF